MVCKSLGAPDAEQRDAPGQLWALSSGNGLALPVVPLVMGFFKLFHVGRCWAEDSREVQGFTPTAPWGLPRIQKSASERGPKSSVGVLHVTAELLLGAVPCTPGALPPTRSEHLAFCSMKPLENATGGICGCSTGTISGGWGYRHPLWLGSWDGAWTLLALWGVCMQLCMENTGVAWKTSFGGEEQLFSLHSGVGVEKAAFCCMHLLLNLSHTPGWCHRLQNCTGAGLSSGAGDRSFLFPIPQRETPGPWEHKAAGGRGVGSEITPRSLV